MKILFPNKNTDVGPLKKILCVLKPTQIYPLYEKMVFRGCYKEGMPHGKNLLQKIIIYPVRAVFYRANPRSMDYMLAFALSFLRETFKGIQIDLLVEENGWKEVSDDLKKGFSRVFQSAHPNFFPFDGKLLENIKQQKYDAAALLYADAVGLSWWKAERIVHKLKCPLNFVINGRKKVFLWDREARRKLYLRRILEKTWFFEIILSLGFFIFTPFLLLYDLIAKNTETKNCSSN